jgi:hypothetical protein
LTENEVLAEFRRIGIKEPSLLREHLTEFAEYIGKNYDMKILKSQGNKAKEEGSSERKMEKGAGSRFPICRILIPLFIAARAKTSTGDGREGK